MDVFPKRAALRATTSAIVMAAVAGPVWAQDAFVLDEIVVNESKREVQTETAISVTEVDQAEIEDRQANTIGELIDSVPGVSLVNGSTPSGSGINIRGFGAVSTFFGTDQKVAVVIDGATTGSEELYRIGTQTFTDPALYKTVTVQRGSTGSFEYGTGIIGGVVFLETKDASDFTGGEIGWVVNQTLGFATNGDGLDYSTILAWQPNETSEFLFNYARSEQSTQVDANGANINGSEYDLPSFLLKGRFAFGDANEHSLELIYNRSSSSQNDIFYDTFNTDDVDGFGLVDRDTKSDTFSALYNFNPVDNDLVNLDVELTYANSEIDQAYVPGSSLCDDPLTTEISCFDFFFGFGDPRRGNGVIDPGEINDFNFGIGSDTVNADHQYETTKLLIKNTSLIETGAASHELRYGLELLRKERLDASAAPGGTGTRYAFFVVDDITWNNFTISPALRYESSEIDPFDPAEATTDADALVGGLSVRYAFDSGWSVFGSYSYTESLPIIDDIGSSLVEVSEEATTYEVGTAFSGSNVFGDGDVVAFKAVYYDLAVEDITSTGRGRVAAIEQQGLEIEASYAADSGVYVDLNANVVQADRVGTDGSVVAWTGQPQDTLRVTVGRRFADELDLSWEFVQGFEFEEGTDRNDSFSINNLRATYAPKSGILSNTEFRFGVENIFNEDATPRLSSRPFPGRNFKVTISTEF